MHYRQDVMQSVVYREYWVNCYHNSNPTKYLAQSRCPIILILENFCHQFAILVAPPTDGTTKRLMRYKVPYIVL